MRRFRSSAIKNLKKLGLFNHPCHSTHSTLEIPNRIKIIDWEESARRFWLKQKNKKPQELPKWIQDFIQHEEDIKSGKKIRIWQELSPEESQRIGKEFERILIEQEERQKYTPY